QIFWPRENEHEYSLVDGGDKLYVLTNWQAKNFRLMEASYSARDKKQWRENGLTQIRVRPRDGGQEELLKFPDPAYEVSAAYLPDYKSDFIRFNYQSL